MTPLSLLVRQGSRIALQMTQNEIARSSLTAKQPCTMAAVGSTGQATHSSYSCSNSKPADSKAAANSGNREALYARCRAKYGATPAGSNNAAHNGITGGNFAAAKRASHVAEADGALLSAGKHRPRRRCARFWPGGFAGGNGPHPARRRGSPRINLT